VTRFLSVFSRVFLMILKLKYNFCGYKKHQEEYGFEKIMGS